MALVCVSLTASDTELLFMAFLAIHISSLDVRVFCPFPKWFVFSPFACSLDIGDQALCWTCGLQIFSPLVSLSSDPLNSLSVSKVLPLDQVQFMDFGTCFEHLRTSLPLNSKDFLLFLFPKVL